MRTTIGTIALILALMPVARAAEESIGDKVDSVVVNKTRTVV